jgi:molybdenum cofactor cytidylyltransferase
MKKKNTPLKKCSVLLLAAGKSQRMGKAKLLLPFNDTGVFLEEIIQNYKNFNCQEIIVVLNNEGNKLVKTRFPQIIKDCTLVVNSRESSERFYSIQLGIKHLQFDYPVFIHNIDNPFASPLVLNSLFEQDYSDYVIPQYRGKGGHPILLSHKVAQALLASEKDDLILSNFLKHFNQKRVEIADKRILFNINTQEDYLGFLSLK